MSDSSHVKEQATARLGKLTPALLGGAGLLGSTLLFWSMRSSELESARNDLERFADERAARVEQALAGTLETVHSTVALFDSSVEVVAEEFRTFTSDALERHEPIRSMLWCERQPNGSTVRHVVRFAEGREAAVLPIGATLESMLSLPSIEGARDRVVLSAPFEVRPPNESGSHPRVLAMIPVFDARDAPVGVVGGLLDVERLLGGPDAARELLIEDVTGESATLLGGDTERSGGDTARAIEAGGRTWRLLCSTPGDFVAKRTTVKPWVVLLLGLLATGFLVVAVVGATGRARIQSLVDRRTKEVQAAYDTLAHEARERAWAVAESDRLERQMREVIDLVPDMIYVKDWHGRMLLANQATAEALGSTIGRLTGPGNIDFNTEASEPDAMLQEERHLMKTRTCSVIQALPFVHAEKGRRILRVTKIPCDLFGDERDVLLCVATDITDRVHAESILQSQNRILSELAEGSPPRKVLADLVGAAEEIVIGLRCSVLLLAPDGRHLIHGSAPSLPQFYNEAIDGIEVGPDVGSCGSAAFSGERVVVEDVMTHPSWEPYRELAQRARIRACWSQPIRSSGGNVLGTFAMYYEEPRKPEPFELQLSESMAHLAGIAIEREVAEAAT